MTTTTFDFLTDRDGLLTIYVEGNVILGRDATSDEPARGDVVEGLVVECEGAWRIPPPTMRAQAEQALIRQAREDLARAKADRWSACDDEVET